MSPMKIAERQVGDVTVLDLHGALRFGENENMLRDAMSRLLDSGKRKVLVNLADVPHMDSAGLGEVVRCYATVGRAGGAMKLVNLTARIRDLLTITKLLTVFEVFDSEEQAIRSFRS